MGFRDSIKIVTVDRTSPHISAIKTLWRGHANTLGFFPEGAFDAYAEKKQILVAQDGLGTLLGYLLYRITPSRNDASIVHLCVNPIHRGNGIAMLLVRKLQDSTRTLRGIGLNCRRDFDVNKLWPKLGFIPISEKAGRSSAGSTLTFWWYDHNHPTLFTLAEDADLVAKRKVVIDANIFYDLKDQRNEESLALTADWLDDSIAICVCDELLTEINRASSVSERDRCRSFLTRFPTLRCDGSKLSLIRDSLTKYLPDKPSEQDLSDFAHLAKALASEADFFVTRDEGILSCADEIYEEFSMPIFRPSDFITEIDALYREREYQPARLAGTLYAVSRVQSKSEDIMLATFQNSLAGERQANFKDELRKILSSPQDSECYVAWDQQNKPIGLMGYNFKAQNTMHINLLRVPPHHQLAPTIARFQLGELIKTAFTRKCPIIQIKDDFLNKHTIDALQEDQFIPTEHGWFKLCLDEHVDSSELILRMDHIGRCNDALKGYAANLRKEIEIAKTREDKTTLWEIETALGPGLITDSDIPCFIVPIKPFWAQQLFDKHLAEQDLFGAKVNLALNREGVYYRSKQNSFGLKAPARIIWYVSKDMRFIGSGSLRAYSRLDEVVVDHPKPLFRQFRRLGIYEWKDVFETAKSATKQLMALRFSKTMLFRKPVPWEELISVLSEHGIKTQLQSPCPIPEDLFFSLISQA
ncbi:MAG TPA: GNAT family N-acetyltransferase [Methylophilaceae bacterium]|nr:GNAT family N-acetyltransferase [Methylophilaceae bacterium]